jgi:hypothetical protein
MMAKKRKTIAFTLAVVSGAGAGPRTFAVLAQDAPSAVRSVRAAVGSDCAVELCGGLSGRLAARLGLKAGEVRPV